MELKTDQPRAHCVEDYMTLVTAVAAGGGCPRWLAFLDRIIGGDSELQPCLQRLAGCA